jgi:hypothetical protein
VFGVKYSIIIDFEELEATMRTTASPRSLPACVGLQAAYAGASRHRHQRSLGRMALLPHPFAVLPPFCDLNGTKAG